MIVAHVHRELSHRIPSTHEDLVGMEWRVNKVIEMLKVEESDKVFAVGIWKMGGAGKTTIGRAVFDMVSHSYESSCFLQIPIGECSENGLKVLQKTLLSDLLNLKPEEIYISDTRQGINMMKQRLHAKKVLIVLDNVDHRKQLNALAAEHEELFGRGSRIIITTRDNQLLNKVNEAYELELLNNTEAMQLFSWHAFRRTEPDVDFAELSSQVVEYAKGLPLALQVLGSNLEGLSPEEWPSQIIKLQNIPPDDDILSVLKISYDRLDETNKSIFLDVACLFRGMNANEVIRVLDSFESYFKIGINPLVRKSLVFVENGKLQMHDLVQEMGRSIARKNHPRSRLWEQKEIIDALNGSQECEAVEAIVHPDPIREDLFIDKNAVMRMKNLRLLWLLGLQYHSSECLEDLPNSLQWIEWNNYPWDSLPLGFDGEKLAGLIMQRSHMVELFRVERNFKELKIMDLSYSFQIKRTPDLSKLPCLEELNMRQCLNLVEVHSSLGVHKKLRLVDFVCCPNLKVIPETIEMESLERFYLNGCRKMEKFPNIDGNNTMMTALEVLGLSSTRIRRLPHTFRNLTGLRSLYLSGCELISGSEQDNQIQQLDNSPSLAVTTIRIENGNQLRIHNTLLPLPQSITHLYLQNCSLTNLVIPQDCLPSLLHLGLASNPLTGLLISKVCLSSISFLDITWAFVQDKYQLQQLLENGYHQLLLHTLLNMSSSMVSLHISSIHISESEDQSHIFDWEALSSTVVRERNSHMTIKMSGIGIPKWFNRQVRSQSCEVILPPTLKFRGLAFCAYYPVPGVWGCLYIKHCCQKQKLIHQHFSFLGRILFHYVPSSHCTKCFSFTSESAERICLLDSWNENMIDVEWGIQVVYDEADRISVEHYDDITVNPLPHDIDRPSRLTVWRNC